MRHDCRSAVRTFGLVCSVAGTIAVEAQTEVGGGYRLSRARTLGSVRRGPQLSALGWRQRRAAIGISLRRGPLGITAPTSEQVLPASITLRDTA
jgi:hypothetical protein